MKKQSTNHNRSAKGGEKMTIGKSKIEDSKVTTKILYLPCSKLEDHPLHFGYYEQSHLDGLVQSIGETGLLNPIIVYPMESGKYRILSGHYRIRAVRRLRYKMVLCRMVECDERFSYIIYCTSNLLTRGLSAIEEAYMISKLISETQFTMSEIGKLWGRSKSWVSRRAALLKHLAPKIRKEVGMGYLSPRIAQELTRLPQGNVQERVLKIIKKMNMTKDEVSAFVTQWINADEKGRDALEANEYLKLEIRSNTEGFLAKKAATGLTKCINILEQLLITVEQQDTIDWWPSNKYSDLNNLLKQIDRLLTKKLISNKVIKNETNI